MLTSIGLVAAGVIGFLGRPYWQAALLLVPVLAVRFIGFNSAASGRRDAGLASYDPLNWLLVAGLINLAALSIAWLVGRAISRRRGARSPD